MWRRVDVEIVEPACRRLSGGVLGDMGGGGDGEKRMDWGGILEVIRAGLSDGLDVEAEKKGEMKPKSSLPWAFWRNGDTVY